MNDWRRFRPAIWLAMVGIALLLVVNVYVGIALVGGAIGIGARIARGPRRRARRSGLTRRPRRPW